MRLTDHAREQMERRRISPKRVARALAVGVEYWSKGSLLVRHGRLCLVINPDNDSVITAFWRGPHPPQGKVKAKKRKKKKVAA